MKHIHTCLLLRGPPNRKAVRVGVLLGDASSAPVPDCSRIDSCSGEVDLAQNAAQPTQKARDASATIRLTISFDGGGLTLLVGNCTKPSQKIRSAV